MFFRQNKIFQKKFLIIPLISSLALLKNYKIFSYKIHCIEDEKSSFFNSWNYKLLRLEKKLDYLLDREKLKLTSRDFPKFSDHHNLLQKVLDESTWNKIFMLRTEEGYTINDIIQPGIDNPEHPIGVVAVTKDAYYAFEEILIKIACIFHHRNITLVKYEKENLESLKKLIQRAEEIFEKSIVGIDITTHRNLESYSFTSKISRNDRREVAKEILNAIKFEESSIFSQNGRFSTVEAPSSGIYSEFYRACGFFRDWPDGRYSYINNNISINVNEDDHLKITLRSENNDMTHLKQMVNYYEFLDRLGKKITFAYDENMGYLTSIPTNLGSGAYFKLRLRVPTINDGTFESHFKKNCNDLLMVKRDVQSNKNDDGYTLYEITNLSSFYNLSQLLVELVSIKNIFLK